MSMVIGGNRRELLKDFKNLSIKGGSNRYILEGAATKNKYPSICKDFKDLGKRLSRTPVNDNEVMEDLEASVKDICSINPDCLSCKVAETHLEDAKKSMKKNGDLEMVEEHILNSVVQQDGKKVTFDVYTTPCPCKETTEEAINISQTGLCAPQKKEKVLNFITKVVKEYEKTKNKIEPKKQISSNKDINKIASVLNFKCDTEDCVLSSVVENNLKSDSICDKLGINNDIKDECVGPLKPTGPRSNTTWLSNDNTDEVLYDIEKEFPEFFAFKTTMSDFNEGGDEWLHNPKRKSLSNATEIIKEHIKTRKANCFGCILNTDKTVNCKDGKCGIHWVSIFIDTRRSPEVPWTIEYFDSVGDPPNSEICEWQEKLRNNLESFREKKGDVGGVICEINNIQHQQGNNECGVYGTYFIRARVEGIPFSRFLNRKLPDYIMIQYRRNIFSEKRGSI